MGKGMYIGVNGLARKVKKMYVGVNTELPIYGESTTLIRYSNISQYFSVQDDAYAFKFGVGTTSHIATSTNKGISSSTAKTTLTAKQDMDINFDYSYSSEQNYDKFTLIVAGTTVESAVSGATTTKSYSGSLKTGQSIVFQYAKDGSQNKNDDQCTFSNMNVTARTQTGTETKDVARKVKKAYIGVGGVARPCFSLGGVEYYGTITNLPNVGIPTGVSFGDYAVFIRGKNVVCYDTNLVMTTPATLNNYGSTVGFNNNYIVTNNGSTSSYSTSVEAIDKNMVRSNASSLSTEAYNRVGSGIGGYALIGYGCKYDEYGQPDETIGNNVIDTYSDSLVRGTISYGISGASYRKAATNEKYVIFGPGSTGRGNMNTTPQAFNSTLTRTNCSSDWSRLYYGCASVNNYAMFGGGYQQGGT
jgi:hypothetical protein